MKCNKGNYKTKMSRGRITYFQTEGADGKTNSSQEFRSFWELLNFPPSLAIGGAEASVRSAGVEIQVHTTQNKRTHILKTRVVTSGVTDRHTSFYASHRMIPVSYLLRTKPEHSTRKTLLCVTDPGVEPCN